MKSKPSKFHNKFGQNQFIFSKMITIILATKKVEKENIPATFRNSGIKDSANFLLPTNKLYQINSNDLIHDINDR